LSLNCADPYESPKPISAFHVGYMAKKCSLSPVEYVYQSVRAFVSVAWSFRSSSVSPICRATVMYSASCCRSLPPQ